MSTRLAQLVEKLPPARVLLAGDFMLDRYLFGNAERLSPEAPVPVLHYQREEDHLGGAGRVAEDLTTLGLRVDVLSALGNDAIGRQIRQMLARCGASHSHIVGLSDRPSTCKTRLVGLAQHRHPQQMFRLDFEDASPLDGAAETELLSHAQAAMAQADLLCIQDYNKGVLTPRVCQALIGMARQRGIEAIVDPAGLADYSRYAGATALKPNRFEAARATGLSAEPEHCGAVGKALMERLGLEASIITLDRHGIFLSERGGQARWIRGRERKAYDVAGAGDMVLAMLCAARAGGASWSEAVILGNTAGGLECEKFGAVPITRQEIVQELMAEAHLRLGKQRTIEQLLPELAMHRGAGRKIVFTNGCFDLIHHGHVSYFRFAKQQGDLLVVAVNTDAGIRRLKGPRRPIITEDDRMAVLEELESIDYLVKFDDDTPLDLIRQIRPDVLVKGADYSREQVVGWDVVEAYGGRVALAPLMDGRSTSGVIQRILETYR